MWENIIRVCENRVKGAGSTMTPAKLRTFMLDFYRELSHFSVDTGEDLRYGRYLLHQSDNYNIQLDIFSRSYLGSIHCHETWGIFGLVSGSLIVEDWQEVSDGFFLERVSYLIKGSCNCFSPPFSDWHRVATSDADEQTVTVHIYGKGFNLEEGIYLDENHKKFKSLRSSFKNNEDFYGKIIYQ